jgi:hypothetical protein
VLQATSLGVSARCRYGRVEDNISLTAARTVGGATNGALTSIRPVLNMDRASLVDGLLNGGLCPATGQFTGTSGPITGLNNTNTITITLI